MKMSMHKLKYSLDKVEKMIKEWELRGWSMYVVYVQLGVMGVVKYTVSCEFYLNYENGKWIVEQEFPELRVVADDFETALRGAMERWITILKTTKEGQKWIYLLQQEGKVTLWDLNRKERDE